MSIMPLDIALINPPSTGSYGFLEKARDRRPPLGLTYIAAYLEKSGYRVRIFDFDVEDLTPEGLLREFQNTGVRAAGISTTTPTIMTAIDIAGRIKNACKDILVIAGGPHATALPEETLKRSKIDIIVRGEGEITCLEILKRLDSGKGLEGLEGVSFKKDGSIVHNLDRPLLERLDHLPFPARHLLKMERYKTNNYLEAYGDRFANIMGTRGCPYRCSFCGQDIIFKNTIRSRSAKNIADEFEELQNTFGIKVCLFEDSTFTALPALVEETCKEILKRGLAIKWGAMGRVNLADEKLYRLMKQAGCILVFYGIESGNQEVLERAHKGITLSMARDAVRIAKRAGLPVNASFILGLPGENRKTITETIDFAVSLDPDYATFSLATPYPGTEFYDTVLKEGYDLSDWNIFTAARYVDPIYVPKDMSKEELLSCYRLAYKKFYFRPGYIIRSLAKIRSMRDLLHKVQIARGLV